MAKHEKWITADGLLMLAAYARDGLTDEQIAKKVGCSRSTLAVWKEKFPEIGGALKRGKEVVDVEVENKLLKNAMGYEYHEEVAFKCKTVSYDAEGRRIETEEIKTAEVKRWHPAETVAQIFWLKNRKPEDWKDRREIDTEEGVIILHQIPRSKDGKTKRSDAKVRPNAEAGNVPSKQG